MENFSRVTKRPPTADFFIKECISIFGTLRNHKSIFNGRFDCISIVFIFGKRPKFRVSENLVSEGVSFDQMHFLTALRQFTLVNRRVKGMNSTERNAMYRDGHKFPIYINSQISLNVCTLSKKYFWMKYWYECSL